ncbi:hypothetical protein BN1723_007588 [Verticillium longisporum]|uniref:Uncharacterized protein n=1 Tax=Verticillium longisporum TaxID=100787 RepID=A0A0G4NM98_VERLO|nr:hypothetical protein BN1723_007588 [Verticillium longisporum]
MLDAGLPGAGAAEPSSEGRRPLNLPGAGKWREKEAARGAAGASDNAPPAPRQSAPMERTDSSDRAGGPPRLSLAGSGGKPSWREREAARAAAGGAENSAPPQRSERLERPERTASGGAPMGRTASNRDDQGRNASPAPATEQLKASGAPGKWVPRHLRKE